MRQYASADAFRRALEDRLHKQARAEGIDLQRMRRKVAFDRLLARLSVADGPAWCLKGGYALELKLSLARSTRDLDLGITGVALNRDDLLGWLQDAAALDIGDFFVYAVGESTMELEGAPYGGFRHPVEAILNGRVFAKFHLDVGMGDGQNEPFELTAPRDWLGFAGIAAAAFPSIAREEHFAQKLHAYSMPREGRMNSRVKDLVDLVLLIEAGGLDEGRLKRDIRGTFERRGSHPLPSCLTPPPDFWEPVFVKLAEECRIDRRIDVQFGKVAEYCQRLL